MKALRSRDFDYYNRTYRAARDAAFARSGGRCQLCGINRATEAHHWALRYPEPDDTEPEDLTALCTRCHGIATDIRREYTKRAWKRKPLRALPRRKKR